MPEAKSTEGAEVPAEVKTEAQIPEVKEGDVSDAEKPSGLSRRDALEVALEAHKEPGRDAAGRFIGEEKKSEKLLRGTDKGKKGTGNAVEKEAQPSGDGSATSNDKPSADPAQSQLPALQPPAEWSAEEKADFAASSRKAQEAALRLHHSRMGILEDIKRAKAENASLKELADSMGPYLRAVGVDQPSEVALKKALKMWREFEDGDPRAAAAAYLRAKKVAVPKELEAAAEGDGSAKVPDSQISALQTEVNNLKQEREQEKRSATAAVLQQEWGTFESSKNGAGASKYPDINNTDAGLKLSRNIGSLVCGTTELSKQFIANVKDRIPDLTYGKLLEEAYRYLGGRVDDSQATRTQESPEEKKRHLVQSSRAAASVPGRGVGFAGGSAVKKFATRREALAYAIQQSKEE